jgi:hypothetical protein
MKTPLTLLLFFFVHALANADELRVSAKEPLVVVAPDQWTSTEDKSPTASFPADTFRLAPPVGRNAECLISILDKDKAEFADPQFLKRLLRGDSRPYVSSPEELAKLDLKELKIDGGLGFYANFVDPDMVGKPVKEGSYKTATPILLSIGSKYLIKVTVLCDEIDGADYRDAIKIVESIRIKEE